MAPWKSWALRREFSFYRREVRTKYADSTHVHLEVTGQYNGWEGYYKVRLEDVDHLLAVMVALVEDRLWKPKVAWSGDHYPVFVGDDGLFVGTDGGSFRMDVDGEKAEYQWDDDAGCFHGRFTSLGRDVVTFRGGGGNVWEQARFSLGEYRRFQRA